VSKAQRIEEPKNLGHVDVLGESKLLGVDMGVKKGGEGSVGALNGLTEMG